MPKNTMFESNTTALLPACCGNCGLPLYDMEGVQNDTVEHYCPDGPVAFGDLELRGFLRLQADRAGEAPGKTLAAEIRAGRVRCPYAPADLVRARAAGKARRAAAAAALAADPHARDTARQMPSVRG